MLDTRFKTKPKYLVPTGCHQKVCVKCTVARGKVLPTHYLIVDEQWLNNSSVRIIKCLSLRWKAVEINLYLARGVFRTLSNILDVCVFCENSGFKPLPFFAENSILDIWKGSGYVINNHQDRKFKLFSKLPLFIFLSVYSDKSFINSGLTWFFWY